MNQVNGSYRIAIVCLLVILTMATAQCTRPAPTVEAPIADMPNPASVNCENKGGKLEIRTDASGGQVGICIFSDGSECEEWAFFRGECAPGDSLAAPEQPATDTPAPPETATSAPPTETPVPPATATPVPPDTPAPTATSAPEEPTPVPFSMTSSATTLTIDGHLAADEYLEFPFAGNEGQPVLVRLSSSSEKAVFAIYGVDSQQVLPGTSQGATNWQGRLPSTQTYKIRLFAPGASANYRLSVRMPIVIEFETGATSASIEGAVAGDLAIDYVARASEGQTATVKITSEGAPVKLAIFGLEDDAPLLGFDEAASEWTGTLPSTQDYLIVAIPTGQAATFTLDLTIE